MSAEFFLTHGAAESTAGTEPLLGMESGESEKSGESRESRESMESGEFRDSRDWRGPGGSQEAGDQWEAREDREAGESERKTRGAIGESQEEPLREWAKGGDSYDELKSNFYTAASRILGSPAEELAKMKPSELAEQLSPKLEEYEGIRSAYEVAKPFVEILGKPANLINSTEFAKALAEERPSVYGRLAEDLVLVHTPDYLGRVVSSYDQYAPNERQEIDSAMENHMVMSVHRMTGWPMTGDQLAEAVGLYVWALKEGQNPVEIYSRLGLGAPPRGRTGNAYMAGGGQFAPAALTSAVAEQIAGQLGVEVGDPAVGAAWSMMQQQSAQMARQFGGHIQGLQGKLAMLEQGQRQTSETLNQRREVEVSERLNGELNRARDELIGKLQVPKGYEDELEVIRGAVENLISKSTALQSLRDQIKGWYLEGNPQRAAGLIGRYTSRIGQIVAEVSGPRLRRIEAYENGRAREVEKQGKRRELPSGGSHVGPGERTNGRPFKNEDEAADAIVGQAMEWLRAKGKEV